MRLDLPAGADGFCISVAVRQNNQAYIGYSIKDGQYTLWGNVNGRHTESELPYRSSILPAAEWVKLD